MLVTLFYLITDKLPPLTSGLSTQHESSSVLSTQVPIKGRCKTHLRSSDCINNQGCNPPLTVTHVQAGCVLRGGGVDPTWRPAAKNCAGPTRNIPRREPLQSASSSLESAASNDLHRYGVFGNPFLSLKKKHVSKQS